MREKSVTEIRLLAQAEAKRTKASVADRAKFNDLRRRWLTASDKAWEARTILETKYGGGLRPLQWAKPAERRRLDELGERADKLAELFSANLQAISPRDWTYGVPYHWVLRELTFEDAVRPKNEPLSVVVPLSYGSNEHHRIR